MNLNQIHDQSMKTLDQSNENNNRLEEILGRLNYTRNRLITKADLDDSEVESSGKILDINMYTNKVAQSTSYTHTLILDLWEILFDYSEDNKIGSQKGLIKG